VVEGGEDTIANIYYDLRENIPIVIIGVCESNTINTSNYGAVILFRNVEHCGISSAPGTSSIRFRELDRHSI